MDSCSLVSCFYVMATSLLHALIILALLQLHLATRYHLPPNLIAAASIFFQASAQHTDTDTLTAEGSLRDIDAPLSFGRMSTADNLRPDIQVSGDRPCASSPHHMDARHTAEGSPADAYLGCKWTKPDTVENIIWPDIAIQAGSSAGPLSVLIFQTSLSVLVPCLTTRMIRPPRNHEPPVRVIIATPTQTGTYPVILFKHGFSLANCFYTQLFEYISSSGYIVVAPQAVTLDPDTTEEIEETAKVANWIPRSLAVVLNAAVSNARVFPDVSKMVMAGHSRGGKVAFAMALHKTSSELPSFSALATLDPVDGMGPDAITKPPIVEAGCDHTLNQMPFPVLILGTGYGSRTGMLGMPPCAPTCCNHAKYFNCSSSPIMYHFVASNFGHLDFLDDSQIWTPGMCMSGSSKPPLRDFSGRLIVAFLESALEGEQGGMDDMIENWETASITLEEPQIYSTKFATF